MPLVIGVYVHGQHFAVKWVTGWHFAVVWVSVLFGITILDYVLSRRPATLGRQVKSGRQADAFLFTALVAVGQHIVYLAGHTHDQGLARRAVALKLCDDL